MMLDIALSETVFRLARLRLADGVPMAIERAAVPLRFLGGAEPDRQLALRRPRGGWASVRCARCSGCAPCVVGAAEAALLEIAEGAPALDIHRVAYVADGRRVEFTRRTYRSDTYDFVAELTLPPGARARERKECRDDRDLHGDRNRRDRRGDPPAARRQPQRDATNLAAELRGRRAVLCRDDRARQLGPRRPSSSSM